ncbi:TIC110 protein [Nymphaea thermarum]|nr:TIC110 protein [Nymphaea thermarum]
MELTALDNLKDIFGLNKSKAERIMLEVFSVFYLRRLSKAFSQGELERATSKGTFLHNEVHFDPFLSFEDSSICIRAAGLYSEFYMCHLGELDSRLTGHCPDFRAGMGKENLGWSLQAKNAVDVVHAS